MGTIYRNGTAFIGSGGAGGVELTQAEYDALPTTEKMNGSIYFISDGEASYPSASTMRYDNSTSGLTATSVQAAVDEVNEKVNGNAVDIATLNNGLRSIQTLDNFIGYKDRTVSNISISSDNGYASLGNVYTDWGLPSGAYVLGFYVRGWSVSPGTFSLASSSDGRVLYVISTKAGTIGQLTIRVWYAKF